MDYQTVRRIVAEHARKEGLTLVVLFGSRARGTARKDSDMDIALLAEKRISTEHLARLQYVLMESLQGIRVDLVDVADAPPLLLRAIALEGKPLYERTPAAFAMFRVQAMMRYFDAKPLLDLRKQLTLSRTQHV